MLNLAHVITALTHIEMQGIARPILDVVVDSREVSPGAMFVALPGEKADGHDYVQDAFDRGAAFALVQKDFSNQFPQIDLRLDEQLERIEAVDESPLCLRVEDSLSSLQTIAQYWRRQLNVRVIGITGSVGKSTTKEVVAEVLSRRYSTLKNPGNLNNEIGLPLTLLHLTEEHERAVLEMGFYVPGEIRLLCELASPSVGIVTNIGTVHAERAGSIEEIVRGKTELVESLPPAPLGLAILNYDDLRVREMASKTLANVFYYGLSPEADLWADGVEGLGLDGIRFQMHYQNEVLHLRVPLIGRHSVHTALRAAAVGLNDGLTWQEIFDGLHESQAQLRLVVARAESGALILDDTYNASPESTLAALNLLDEMDGRKIAVLGDMLELGQYEQEGHELVGARAAEVVDKLVTVGNRGKLIAYAAALSGLPDSAILIFENNRQAITYLSKHLETQDVVLIKGSRGMKMEGIVAALEAVQ